MLKKCSLLLIGLFLYSLFSISLYANTETQDLKRRVQSLEVELEKIKIQLTEIQPVKRTNLKQWGQGLTIGTSYSNNSVFEIGYAFASDQNIINLIQGASVTRWAIYGGYAYGQENERNGYYAKIMQASPIYAGFISLSEYLQLVYTAQKTSEVYIGAEINFWIARTMSLNVGIYTGGNESPGSEIGIKLYLM